MNAKLIPIPKLNEFCDQVSKAAKDRTGTGGHVRTQNLKKPMRAVINSVKAAMNSPRIKPEDVTWAMNVVKREAIRADCVNEHPHAHRFNMGDDILQPEEQGIMVRRSPVSYQVLAQILSKQGGTVTI